MITLYHGSTVKIETIDLKKGLINKDFGQGFYLTDIYDQAVAMAQRKARLLSANDVNETKCSAIVTTFQFDDSRLFTSELKYLSFEGPTAEWAKFIVANRHASRTGFKHDYDIVYGPVANDGVFDQLRRYEQGRISAEELAEELTYQKLNNQYFFGTERALEFLIRI